jgi:nicotinamidase-related amidase
MSDSVLHLTLRTQVIGQDDSGHACWRVIEAPKEVSASKTVLLLCDVWNDHWCRGAAERVDVMVPRMDEVVKIARDRGVQIIHAPSDTMGFYAGTPARQRMIDVPYVEPPTPEEHPEPSLPIDDSDGGSDTGEKPWHKAWSRQHPVIEIDHERDGISDSGQEIYNFLRQKGIPNLILMGVHTNMCVLNRSFAIKRMVRWGVDVALARDLTDAMYNPAMPPYVSHEEGTRLVIEYIEKFWCPTIESRDLVR